MALRARTVGQRILEGQLGGLRNHEPCLKEKTKANKHPLNGNGEQGSSRTLLRLANLHRNVREGDLDRPRSLNLLVVVIVFAAIVRVHHTTIDERVDVGVVRVNLAGTDERVTVPGLTVASSRVSTAPSVGGILSLNTAREVVLEAVSGPLR